jgi:hypothetical protein
MKSRLFYIELKTGFNDNGPAWIGKAFFSKSGQTIYFNGLVLKGSGKGNCQEIESGDIYWASGIKKNGNDRHWAGSGKISIDRDVVEEYLQIVGLTELPKTRYTITQLNNVPNITGAHEIENKKSNPK